MKKIILDEFSKNSLYYNREELKQRSNFTKKMLKVFIVTGAIASGVALLVFSTIASSLIAGALMTLPFIFVGGSCSIMAVSSEKQFYKQKNNGNLTYKQYKKLEKSGELDKIIKDMEQSYAQEREEEFIPVVRMINKYPNINQHSNKNNNKNLQQKQESANLDDFQK